MRHGRLFALILIPVLLVLAGCGVFGIGEKKAGTPEAQGLLDTGKALQALSNEFIKTNGTYRTRCNPAARTLTLEVCNAYADFWPRFQVDYIRADEDWTRAAANADVKLQQDVAARVKKLAAELKIHVDKTK